MRELIAYTDGGSRGNRDAAAGVYFPNGIVHDEVVVKSIGAPLGKRSNNEAEYSALILALEMALTHKYERLKVFSDSELMVNQMRGKYRVNAPTITPLFNKAYSLACQLDFEINWIPRESNTEADAVVNNILDKVQAECGQRN